MVLDVYFDYEGKYLSERAQTTVSELREYVWIHQSLILSELCIKGFFYYCFGM